MHYTIETASQYCGRVVILGSGSEYNPTRYKPLMSESHYSIDYPPDTSNTYIHSKYTISRLHQNSPYTNIYNLRLFGVFGPHEDYNRRLISNNLYNFHKNGFLSYSSNISFDYIFVDDVLDAIMILASSSSPMYRTYNVCTGNPRKFDFIVSQIAEIVSCDPSLIKCENPGPNTFEYSGNPSLFESEFNYKIEKTTFNSALIEVDNWLKRDVLNSD